MVRAFFAAVGISLCILGAECLLVDSAVLASAEKLPVAQNSLYVAAPTVEKKVVKTPEWAPWTFLSAGTIILIYAVTLKRS
jgi:hypothetical protein